MEGGLGGIDEALRGAFIDWVSVETPDCITVLGGDLCDGSRGLVLTLRVVCSETVVLFGASCELSHRCRY